MNFNKHRKKYILLTILFLVTTLTSCNKQEINGNINNSEIGNNNQSDDLNPNIDENQNSDNNEKPEENDIVPETKPETKPDVKPETKPDVKPETKPDTSIEDPLFDMKYDPFYPQSFDDTPYRFEVPSLDKRFILSEDKKTVTLFAPGVSKESGFYDANKNFYNDNHLCWAATSSNLLAWYLDRTEELGIDLTGYQRDVNRIFDNYRNNWNYMEGYDFMQGLAWYFTGETLTGTKPDELNNYPSGGYLRNLPNVGEMWSILDHLNHYPIVGNYELQYPFIDDNLTLDETYESFSKNIVGQLHYGPSGLMILPKGSTATSSHAITLWGCDYDSTTGLVKAIYVTDSDDEAEHAGTYLRRVKIKEESGDHGISMVDYWPTRGNPSPFLYITNATNLFAPNVVKKI